MNDWGPPGSLSERWHFWKIGTADAVREALASGPGTATEVAARLGASSFLSEVSETLRRMAGSGQVAFILDSEGRRVFRLRSSVPPDRRRGISEPRSTRAGPPVPVRR